MATGSSQSTAKQITGILLLSMVPDPTTSIAPGLALVHISTTDDLLVGLPNSPAALLNGRAFAGISVGWNATVIAPGLSAPDTQIPAQRDGIPKAQLKANTSCVAGQPAAYDPVDGGYFVPHTSSTQVLVGKFTQTKVGNSMPQFVGIELTPGAAGLASGGSLLYASPQTGTVSSTAENQYSNATLVLPANYLRASDTINFSAGLIVSNHNAADTLTLRWKINGTVIVQSVATYNPAVGDVMTVRGSLGVAAIGATGIVSAYGAMHYGTMGTAGTTVPGSIAPVIDTTQPITLTLTAQWSASSANDQVDLKSAAYSLSRKSS